MRVQVKNRFEKALDQVYDPPPPDCASEYILGHVKGEARNQVRQDLQQVRSCAGQTLTTAARRLRDSNDSFEDATRKKNRLEGQPKEIQTLSDQISGLDGEISGLIHKVGATENKITTLKADLHTLNADIGRLQDLLSRLGPEQQRMAVAERLAQAFEDLQEDLRPTTAKRIEEKVTKHFLKIADARYKGGIIRLPENELPYIEHPTNAQSIESMSGFERRSFGIAFSLALVEIIRRRIPLIIDTPIGNADGEYRIRTLKAWAEFDADQVIILTHDKEVDLALAHEVADSLNQCFLVKFKGSQQGSLIEPNTYFKK